MLSPSSQLDLSSFSRSNNKKQKVVPYNQEPLLGHKYISTALDKLQSQFTTGITLLVWNETDNALTKAYKLVQEGKKEELEKLRWSTFTKLQQYIYGLWVNAWSLGQSHATKELNIVAKKDNAGKPFEARFSGNAFLATFAKEDNENPVPYPPTFGIPLSKSDLNTAIQQRSLKLAKDVDDQTTAKIQGYLLDAVEKHDPKTGISDKEFNNLKKNINLALGRQAAKEAQRGVPSQQELIDSTDGRVYQRERVQTRVAYPGVRYKAPDGTMMTAMPTGWFSRANTIAATELSAAYSLARLEAYQRAGVEEVVWESVEDLRTCDICRDRNGSKHLLVDILSSTRFASRSIYDPKEYVVPAHPNCRCYLRPIQKEEKEDSGRNPLAKVVSIAAWATGGVFALAKLYALLTVANKASRTVQQVKQIAASETIQQVAEQVIRQEVRESANQPIAGPGVLQPNTSGVIQVLVDGVDINNASVTTLRRKFGLTRTQAISLRTSLLNERVNSLDELVNRKIPGVTPKSIQKIVAKAQNIVSFDINSVVSLGDLQSRLATVGIPEGLATRIYEEMQKKPFESMEDLTTRVKGIGKRRQEQLNKIVQVVPPTKAPSKQVVQQSLGDISGTTTTPSVNSTTSSSGITKQTTPPVFESVSPIAPPSNTAKGKTPQYSETQAFKARQVQDSLNIITTKLSEYEGKTSLPNITTSPENLVGNVEVSVGFAKRNYADRFSPLTEPYFDYVRKNQATIQGQIRRAKQSISKVESQLRSAQYTEQYQRDLQNQLQALDYLENSIGDLAGEQKRILRDQITTTRARVQDSLNQLERTKAYARELSSYKSRLEKAESDFASLPRNERLWKAANPEEAASYDKTTQAYKTIQREQKSLTTGIQKYRDSFTESIRSLDKKSEQLQQLEQEYDVAKQSIYNNVQAIIEDNLAKIAVNVDLLEIANSSQADRWLSSLVPQVTTTEPGLVKDFGKEVNSRTIGEFRDYLIKTLKGRIKESSDRIEQVLDYPQQTLQQFQRDRVNPELRSLQDTKNSLLKDTRLGKIADGLDNISQNATQMLPNDSGVISGYQAGRDNLVRELGYLRSEQYSVVEGVEQQAQSLSSRIDKDLEKIDFEISLQGVPVVRTKEEIKDILNQYQQKVASQRKSVQLKVGSKVPDSLVNLNNDKLRRVEQLATIDKQISDLQQQVATVNLRISSKGFDVIRTDEGLKAVLREEEKARYPRKQPPEPKQDLASIERLNKKIADLSQDRVSVQNQIEQINIEIRRMSNFRRFLKLAQFNKPKLLGLPNINESRRICSYSWSKG